MTSKFLSDEKELLKTHVEMDEQRFEDVWAAIGKLCNALEAERTLRWRAVWFVLGTVLTSFGAVLLLVANKAF